MLWEDVAADFVCEVWPENADSIQVFHSISTQWRAGPKGVFGLDYSVLPFMFEMNEIPKEKWPDIVADIRSMEVCALDEINNG